MAETRKYQVEILCRVPQFHLRISNMKRFRFLFYIAFGSWKKVDSFKFAVLV